MVEITIPETFTLMNRTWTVKFDDTMSGKKVWGKCKLKKAEILLYPGLPRDALEHTFLHELAHAVCYTLGWEKMNADEGQIDALSAALHQFLVTAEGELL